MSAAQRESELAPDPLSAGAAGGKVIRGSVWRVGAGLAGAALGILTASLLLRHLGTPESGRYVTVISLLAIAVSVADIGLNISGSRWLALRPAAERRLLIANILGQRLIVMPLAVGLMVCFAIVAAYPARMLAGTLLAGAGFLLVALANALLVRLTVELRNVGLALVDFVRQAVTLLGVALLVAAGAKLTPFFAVQLLVGLAVVALVPLLLGRDALVAPRFDRAEQRMLAVSALPLAAALALGQLYFRLVIVLMSLISDPVQTGYFGASLRAVEVPVTISIFVAGVALPLLAAAARDDRERMRKAVEGLGMGAVIAGALVILVTAPIAEPVMSLIGGAAFAPSGAVLRIQVAVLLFNALYQIWTVALLALGRQRELILTNGLALGGLGIAAALLVPAYGARGGAIASVIGDALLAGLIYWRLHRTAGRMIFGAGFLVKVLCAAAPAVAVIVLPGLPPLAAAALAALLFLGTGHLLGMVPPELIEALLPERVAAPLLRLSSARRRPTS